MVPAGGATRRIRRICACAAALACACAALAGAPPAPAAGVSPEPWGFKRLWRPEVPRVKDSAWVRTPIDAFIGSGLERVGLAPAAPAERRVLIRRVAFDIHGLPPTPEELDAFARDARPDAYEKLVERLLASPHYGERWGRHWLDLARYADSDGQEADADRPTAYRYRDFVIRALNDDLPYDTFVRRQLAGDEYEPDHPEAIAATGFLTAGPHAALPVRLLEEERIRERYNELDDILSATGTAFLGLSMGCARCHDHKYDPIPMRDYYRMLAAFNAGERAEVPLLPPAEIPAWRKSQREWEARLEAAKKGGDKAAIRRAEAEKPPEVPLALVHADFGPEPQESWLLERGDFHFPKERVQLGFLSALTRDRPAEAYLADARKKGVRRDTTYQRRAMAEWITDTERGAGALLARVMVNRVWQWHFGEGLVRTTNDFGRRGEAPSHPELLEWLASEFVRGGWRLKPLHRRILLSSAYRQGNEYRPKAAKVDPENRLLWRRSLRRLEAESFRDALLAVAGTLNPRMYGPAFKPPIAVEAMQARNVKSPYPKDARDTPETRRRTVYMFHKRVVQYPLLQAFDAPDASKPCGRRNVTTVAPQALAVLNEPFVRLRATEFAARLRSEAGADAAAQVRLAYRLALAREPGEQELASAVRFLESRAAARTAREPGSDAANSALADFAQVVFGLNEFLYVE